MVTPKSPFLCKKYKKQPKTSQKWLVFGCFLVEAAGLDSRANGALGLPRSRTSTGSPLCTVSPSSPLHDKEKEDIPQGHTFFYLCVNTYFDTICVHLLKNAYTLSKVRTPHKKCIQLNSPINWGFLNAYL